MSSIRHSISTGKRALLAALSIFLVADVVLATSPPPPPRYYDSSPPPPPQDSYARSNYSDFEPPTPAIESAPPPLDPVMKVLYAPFYATGLVLRYGIHYAVHAPLDVLRRARDYGVEGGVDRDSEDY